MISERYAPAIALPVGKRRGKSLRERIPPAPSIAGWRRLASLVGKSFLARLAIALSLVFIAALFYLVQASQVSVDEFAITDLQQQHLSLASQNATLWAQASAKQSLSRIETIATSRFHMSNPDLQSIIWLRPQAPRVQEPSSPNVSVSVSVRRSEPLAWMGNFIQYVKSQL